MATDLLEIREVEEWLEVLTTCKQLEEAQVKRLCEKVQWSLCCPPY